jgi:hypothetical protein
MILTDGVCCRVPENSAGVPWCPGGRIPLLQGHLAQDVRYTCAGVIFGGLGLRKIDS